MQPKTNRVRPMLLENKNIRRERGSRDTMKIGTSLCLTQPLLGGGNYETMQIC